MTGRAKHIKRKALSTTEKLQIINQYDVQAVLNMSASTKEKDIPVSTLRTLLMNRDPIDNQAVKGTKSKEIKKCYVREYEQRVCSSTL